MINDRLKIYFHMYILRWSLNRHTLCSVYEYRSHKHFSVVLRAWSMSFRFEISEVTEWMVLERINSNRLDWSRMSGFTHEKFRFSMQENPLMFLCFLAVWIFLVIKLFAMLMLFKEVAKKKRAQKINSIRKYRI